MCRARYDRKGLRLFGNLMIRLRMGAAFGLIVLIGALGISQLHPTLSAPASVTAPAAQAVVTATSVAPPPTITTTPNPVYSNKATVLFPALVRFVISFTMSFDNVQSAHLQLSQGTNYNVALDVPLKDTLKYFSAGNSFIDYAWPLTEQTEPMPFQPVDFTWTITGKDGQIIKGISGFTYQDQSQQWKDSPVDPLHIYTHDQGLSLDDIRAGALRGYNLISQNTGISHIYTLVIYDAGDAFCQADTTHPNQPVVIDPYDNVEFPCDPSMTAKLYAARGFMLLQRQTGLFEQVIDQVINVIAADSYDTLWKNAGQQPPAWFRSGVIQLYDLIGHPYQLLLAQDAARNDKLFTLDQLAVPPVPQPNDFGSTLRSWNAQSYMLTLYLAEKFGANAPFRIAQQIAQNGTFDGALAAVGSGATIADLYTAWKDWLFTSDANSAIQWNPYILTPTATFTPTPTDFPTLTPTSDQPTATETEFTLPTGTDTAAPPTDTPVPTLPTNTPLPPGSLNTPTAASSPPPTSTP